MVFVRLSLQNRTSWLNERIRVSASKNHLIHLFSVLLTYDPRKGQVIIGSVVHRVSSQDSLNLTSLTKTPHDTEKNSKPQLLFYRYTTLRTPVKQRFRIDQSIGSD